MLRNQLDVIKSTQRASLFFLFPCWERTGTTANDQSPANNDGTLIDSPALQGGLLPDNQPCFDLVTNADYIDMNAHASTWDNDNFSAFIPVKMDSITPTQYPISGQDHVGGNDAFFIGLIGSGATLRVRRTDSSGFIQVQAGVTPTTNWEDMGVTYASGNLKAFHKGVQVGSTATGGLTQVVNLTRLFVSGRIAGGGSQADGVVGLMGNTAAWTKELTADEMFRMSQAGKMT